MPRVLLYSFTPKSEKLPDFGFRLPTLVFYSIIVVPQLEHSAWAKRSSSMQWATSGSGINVYNEFHTAFLI
jgi:hypothetical protein